MRCFSVKNRDRGPDETQGKKIIEQGESKGRNNEQNDSRSEQRRQACIRTAIVQRRFQCVTHLSAMLVTRIKKLHNVFHVIGKRHFFKEFIQVVATTVRKCLAHKRNRSGLHGKRSDAQPDEKTGHDGIRGHFPAD